MGQPHGGYRGGFAHEREDRREDHGRPRQQGDRRRLTASLNQLYGPVARPVEGCGAAAEPRELQSPYESLIPVLRITARKLGGKRLRPAMLLLAWLPRLAI